MHRRLTPPKCIVVHAGQIVVDQGECMNALQCAGQIKRGLGQGIRSRRAGGTHQEKPPNSLSAVQNTMAHGCPESREVELAGLTSRTDLWREQQ